MPQDKPTRRSSEVDYFRPAGALTAYLGYGGGCVLVALIPLLQLFLLVLQLFLLRLVLMLQVIVILLLLLLLSGV